MSIRLVKREDANLNKFIHHLFKLIYNNSIHSSMEAYFTTMYLFCL